MMTIHNHAITCIRLSQTFLEIFQINLPIDSPAHFALICTDLISILTSLRSQPHDPGLLTFCLSTLLSSRFTISSTVFRNVLFSSFHHYIYFFSNSSRQQQYLEFLIKTIEKYLQMSSNVSSCRLEGAENLQHY